MRNDSSEYHEQKERLPIKFEAPTFQGKKGHELYGANWQQHINQVLQQRYGNIRGIQAQGQQAKEDPKSEQKAEEKLNEKEKSGEKAEEMPKEKTSEKAGGN